MNFFNAVFLLTSSLLGYPYLSFPEKLDAISSFMRLENEKWIREFSIALGRVPPVNPQALTEYVSKNYARE